MGDVQLSYWVSGTAMGVKFTHDSSPPLFIPRVANGKLKMSVKVGEHGATVTGGYHSAAPVSAATICGNLLETPVFR